MFTDEIKNQERNDLLKKILNEKVDVDSNFSIKNDRLAVLFWN